MRELRSHWLSCAAAHLHYDKDRVGIRLTVSGKGLTHSALVAGKLDWHEHER